MSEKKVTAEQIEKFVLDNYKDFAFNVTTNDGNTLALSEDHFGSTMSHIAEAAFCIKYALSKGMQVIITPKKMKKQPHPVLPHKK